MARPRPTDDKERRMTDPLGDRMKSYEMVSRAVLMPHSYTILRVDGRAFHSYLRDAEKPYDATFVHDMRTVGQALCAEVSGTRFAYGQSDEISLLLDDTEPQAQPWFGGVVQKMASVAASVATAALIKQRGWNRMPQFDARVFTVPSPTEVANYFIWRQRDAVRNSVSMAAQARFSPSQLHGKNSNQMQEMLWFEHGVNWNDYPDQLRRGWLVTRSVREAEVSYVDRRTGQAVDTVALRTFWDVTAAPHFTVDSEIFA
jgi:tRNA(His) 5'-end guanylyltransferase